MNLPISYNDLQIRLEFPVSQSTKSNLSTSDNVCAHGKKTRHLCFFVEGSGEEKGGSLEVSKLPLLSFIWHLILCRVISHTFFNLHKNTVMQDWGKDITLFKQ